jgi:dihydroorotate dehydrogenase electron transfer subunit
MPGSQGRKPGGGTDARRASAEVLGSERLPGDHQRLLLKAPQVARQAAPGQFVHIWCHPPDEIGRPPGSALLRRPYSISRLRPPDGVEILLRVRGIGGRILSQIPKGRLLDVIGPLGNGFRIRQSMRTAVIVAGGIGLAPVPFMIQALSSRLARVVLLAGAASDGKLPYRVEREPDKPASLPVLASLGAEVEFVSETVEGTLVSDLLEQRLDALDPDSDEVMAIGPRAMLKRLAAITEGRFSLQVSLEERMACGLGACRSCVVPAANGAGYKTVCRDGPVFYAHEVDWERLQP